MEELLNKITQIAGLNEEEKKKVINGFYRKIAFLVVEGVSSVDTDSAQKLSDLIKNYSPDSNDKIKSFMSDLSKSETTGKVVNEKVNSYMNEFTSKIVDSSSEEQRKQIKEIVSQTNFA